MLAVCVGRVQRLPHEGREVATAIFKRPAPGPVRVTRLGLEGDAQADGRHHGGEEKALLVYSATHDAFWREHLRRDLEPGQFGQNLTVSRAGEGEIRLGDAFRCGTARLEVTRPRSPCFKIGIRMGDPAVADAYFASGRWGFYVRVAEEGVVAPGDPWERLATDPARPLLAEVIAEKIRAKQG